MSQALKNQLYGLEDLQQKEFFMRIVCISNKLIYLQNWINLSKIVLCYYFSARNNSRNCTNYKYNLKETGMIP